MAYGDSAIWIGRVPTASPAAEFKIEFQCTFKDQPQPLKCEFSVFTDQEAFEVAALLCANWNEQNGGGASYNSKKRNKRHRVRFDGDVEEHGMKVMGYLPNKRPAKFTPVVFGEKTKVLEWCEADEFGVFNA